MPRPAPADDSYPASLAETFDGSADIDLTARFAEAQYPAAEVIVTNTTAAAGVGEDLVVRFAGNPSVDVAIRIAPQNTMWIRGQFSSIRASTGAAIIATFLWQGGPT
jgi:hypothetical protein